MNYEDTRLRWFIKLFVCKCLTDLFSRDVDSTSVRTVSSGYTGGGGSCFLQEMQQSLSPSAGQWFISFCVVCCVVLSDTAPLIVLFVLLLWSLWEFTFIIDMDYSVMFEYGGIQVR